MWKLLSCILIPGFLAGCASSHDSAEKSEVQINLTFHGVKDSQALIDWFLSIEKWSEVTIEKRGDNTVAMTTVYYGDIYRSLLQKCSQKFGPPKLSDDSVKMALWKPSEYGNIVIAITCDDNDGDLQTRFLMTQPFCADDWNSAP